MMKCFPSIMIMVLLAPASWAGEAKIWLDRMAKAMQTLNYEGTFVYLHDNEIESMRIVHGRSSRGEQERLFSLNGEAREVIRDETTVTCIWPGSGSVNVSKARPRSPFPTEIGKNTSNMEDWYEVLEEGEERIAGLMGRIIAVRPRDKYRYGYRLWLERETDLLLRSELLDERQRPIERLMFTELQVLEEVPNELFRPVLPGTEYTWQRDDEDVVQTQLKADAEWSVSRVAPGFELISHAKEGMTAKPMPVEHLVFSDGLASVSVFIEKIKAQEDVLRGASRMGAINAYGIVLDGYQVTVVGEVPAKTVELMARSVVRSGF